MLRFAWLMAAWPAWCANPAVEFFETRIRPVLATQCYACHSSKLTPPMGGLALDTRAAARAGGKSGPAVVPGNASTSPLIKALEHSGVVKMPPSGKLPEAVIADFRKWIDSGAEDPRGSAEPGKATADWWSLKAIHRPPLPASGSEGSITPIDFFIRAKLKEKGLTPSPQAGPRALARRLYFDLTGLPPTFEELEVFVRDASPNAYEKLVDTLLASPRYGERWARHWMDAAHFAETNGYETDQPREHAWPYRDYLIQALNSDKPYARFIEEQVAGDVLYPDDPQALVATAFLAAGPWDQNTIPPFQPDKPDVIRAYYLDRDDMVATVMSTFNSATVHCARCHDHKFDPITHQDHYSLQAVFAGVDRANRQYDRDPKTNRRRQTLIRDLQALDRMDAKMIDSLRSARVQAGAARWASEVSPRLPKWTVLQPEAMASKLGARLDRQPDGSILASGSNVETETYTITARSPLKRITAVRLELIPDERLPMRGPGQTSLGSFSISELRLKEVSWCSARGDYHYRGSYAENIADGRKETSWKNYPRAGEYRHALLFPLKPIEGEGRELTFDLVQSGLEQVGRFRFSVADHPDAEVAPLVPEFVAQIMGKRPEERNEGERTTLAAHWLRGELERELALLPPPESIYTASTYFDPEGWFAPVRVPRPVQVLQRGEIDQPLGDAKPGALSVLTHLPSRFRLENPADEAEGRAALAKWISHPGNPLTWRSIVNRVWHYHFGRGIAGSPNDFGRMGSAPTHPELLEWLAAEFQSTGGSLKKLHKLIVMSAVYRQSSAPDAKALAMDSDNRMLWRMNRARLDAESLRDAVLRVSGRLDLTQGGPSVRQAVIGTNAGGAPTADYNAYDWNNPGAGRRSIYRFLLRTLSDPFMDALNYPNMSLLAPARVTAVGPLQALAMLNNPFMIRQSEFFAGRLGGKPDPVANAYRLALLREPSAEERAEAGSYMESHGLANLCRVLLNSNEFMYVE